MNVFIKFLEVLLTIALGILLFCLATFLFFGLWEIFERMGWGYSL